MWLVVLIIIISFIYLIPLVSKILDKNIYSYCIKTFIKILLVTGMIALIYNSCLNDIDEEVLLCNKGTDTCTYSVNTHNNKKLQEKNTFLISSIKQVKTRIYKTTSHGRRGRIRHYTHYSIDLYTDAENYFQYPIIPNDYKTLQHKFNKFTSFIKNDEEIKYSDFSKHNIGIIFSYLSLIGVFAISIILGIDISRWKKLQLEKIALQREERIIKNIINEFSNNQKRPLTEKEIITVVSAVKYWRQHNGHSPLMKNAATQFFSSGNAFISENDLVLDTIIWKQWKIECPEDYKKEQDEINKLQSQ